MRPRQPSRRADARPLAPRLGVVEWPPIPIPADVSLESHERAAATYARDVAATRPTLDERELAGAAFVALRGRLIPRPQRYAEHAEEDAAKCRLRGLPERRPVEVPVLVGVPVGETVEEPPVEALEPDDDAEDVLDEEPEPEPIDEEAAARDAEEQNTRAALAALKAAGNRSFVWAAYRHPLSGEPWRARQTLTRGGRVTQLELQPAPDEAPPF